jgi:hypothetical protein
VPLRIISCVPEICELSWQMARALLSTKADGHVGTVRTLGDEEEDAVHGARWIGAAALALASTGCVYPLGLALDTWTWGGYWSGTWEEAPAHVRGDGEPVTEERPVPRFHSLSESGPLRVVLERTGRERVTVTAEEALLPYVDADVRGGVLHIGPALGVSLAPAEEIVVHVECAEVLDITASWGAAVDADLGWLPELWISLRGDASLTAQGEAERQHATLSGGSRLDALDLRSERVEARLSGGSEAWLWVKDRLDVDAHDASRVRFRGNPVVDARGSATSAVTRY